MSDRTINLRVDEMGTAGISILEEAIRERDAYIADLECKLAETGERLAAAELVLAACVKKFEIFSKFQTADKLRKMIERWVKPPAPPKNEAVSEPNNT